MSLFVLSPKVQDRDEVEAAGERKCKYFFSLQVLEGVIIDSRTEPRSRISLLLVNNF
jgi:hypothetical protein